MARVPSAYDKEAHRHHTMTDEELVRLCAEKFMGWDEKEFIKHDTRWRVSPGNALPTRHTGFWNPLTSDADACMVLDRLEALGNFYEVSCYPKCPDAMQSYRCSTWGPVGGHTEMRAETRNRAIVLAALKAVGVEV